jgi:shikimate dehydrogenase
MKTAAAHKVGLIGWPLEHSLSPTIHNAAFGALGLDWEYGLLPTPPGQVSDTLNRLKEDRLQGANVTIPHKQTVMPYLDEVTEAGQAIGAVNTILVKDNRLTGHNTDGDGFLATLREIGWQPEGQRALVLGAGGGARAVVFVLAREGCDVTIYNRTAQRAVALAQDLRSLNLAGVVTWLPDTTGLADPVHLSPSGQIVALDVFDLLVNATPVGMWPDPNATPWPEDLLLPASWTVYDLVYNPADTKLLTLARDSGARSVGGLGMLVYQGALAFEWWTGLAPPVDVMYDAAQTALTRTRS